MVLQKRNSQKYTTHPLLYPSGTMSARGVIGSLLFIGSGSDDAETERLRGAQMLAAKFDGGGPC